MDLDLELMKGNIIYFQKKENDSSITTSILEVGKSRDLNYSPNLENFPNISNVLLLDYIVQLQYFGVYNAQLLKKNKKVIATFNASQFYDALTKLDEGIRLYFVQEENEIVRK